MINLNRKYKKILQEKDKRYFIITGGRGSSKSFSVSTICTLLTYERFNRVLYTRYTLTSASLSIIPEFKEKIELLECGGSFNVLSQEITNNLTGSDILFRGIKTSAGNQTANLKSLQGINTWVLDEAEELADEDEFDKIDLSIRSQKAKNRIILILNPTTVEHWIYQRWFANSYRVESIDGVDVMMSTHPDVCHIHTTYLDNIDNLPKDYLDRILDIKTNNPIKYSQQIIGAWMTRAEGVIFSNWKYGAFDNTLPVVYGMDFGFFPDPTVLVKTAVDNKNKIVYAEELFYAQRLSHNDIEANIRKWSPPNAYIIGDRAEMRILNDLKAVNININPCRKYHNCVVDRIRKLQDYTIIITESSRNLAKELNTYVWLDKKSSTPMDGNDHAIQAITYAVDNSINKVDFSVW